MHAVSLMLIGEDIHLLIESFVILLCFHASFDYCKGLLGFSMYVKICKNWDIQKNRLLIGDIAHYLSFMLWYNITCFIHYSLDRFGCWGGMRDKSAEILFHSVLFWAVVRFVMGSAVHSFTFSNRLFLCRLPSKKCCSARLSCRVRWPIQATFRFLTVCSSVSLRPARLAALSLTSAVFPVAYVQ